MERDFKEEYKYTKAKKQVEKIRGFYSHLVVTVLVVPVVIFINLKFVPGFHWFWFAAGGMLLGLFFHWLGVFGSNFFFGKDWEQRKIKEFMKD